MYGYLTRSVHTVNNFHCFVIIKRMHVFVFEDHMLDWIRAKYVILLKQSCYYYYYYYYKPFVQNEHLQHLINHQGILKWN